MMSLFRGAALALAFAIGFANPAVSGEAGVLVLHRGVGIHDAMNWATMEGKGVSQYVFPPFQDDRHPLTIEELSILKRAGFDFVRLTVDPGPFLQFSGEKREATYRILRERVGLILGANLSVIVNFHPVSQNPEFSAEAIVKDINSPLFGAYCDLLERTAQLLVAFDNSRVALEIINEPPIGGSGTSDVVWRRMQDLAYAKIRKKAPDLTLILTGGIGGYNGLMKLDPTRYLMDPRVYYTFHFYSPLEFTMQGHGVWRLLAGVPYPASSGAIDRTSRATVARISDLEAASAEQSADNANASNIITAYYNTNYGRANISEAFQKVSDWARTNGIPSSRILLGEFGVTRRYGRYRGAQDADRARWLEDVRKEAERRGFAWSVWTYRGPGGMAIVADDGTAELDAITLEALGLR